MNCPACGSAMDAPSFERLYGRRLTIDVCHHCQCLWFDDQEFLQIDAGRDAATGGVGGRRPRA